jgi:hypothetical protein
MLRVAIAFLVRTRAMAPAPPRALVLALSTTVRGGGGPERPPNDLPPASTVTGPGPDTINRVPPQARFTGDEVVSYLERRCKIGTESESIDPSILSETSQEEALDPLGKVGRAVEETMKSTVGVAAEVMAGKREDPIQNVAEEGRCRLVG